MFSKAIGLLPSVTANILEGSRLLRIIMALSLIKKKARFRALLL